MFVCICHAVTDVDVRSAVTSGATDVDSVAARTGASTGCGTCRDTLCGLVDRLAGDVAAPRTALSA